MSDVSGTPEPAPTTGARRFRSMSLLLIVILMVAAAISAFYVEGGHQAQAVAGCAPDSVPIVFTVNSNEVNRGIDVHVRTAGGDVTAVSHDGLSYSPDLSLDGTRVAYAKAARIDEAAGPVGSRIWIVGIGGDGAHAVTGGPLDHDPSWSRDGRTIAYISDDRDGQTQSSAIHLVQADGTADRTVVAASNGTDDTVRRYPTWSPQGKQLAFAQAVVPAGTAPGDASWQIWTVDVATGATDEVLDTGATQLTSLDWSPAGDLLYSAGVNNAGNTYVLRKGAKQPQKLSPRILHSAWSADGSSVLGYQQAAAQGQHDVVVADPSADRRDVLVSGQPDGFLYDGFRVSAAACAAATG